MTFRSPRRDRRDTSAPRRSTGPPRGAGPTSRRAPPERRIFVSNIPFEMKWQEVKDLFRDNVGDVSYVELFNDENDKPRGCGILEFSTENLAKRAIGKKNVFDPNSTYFEFSFVTRFWLTKILRAKKFKTVVVRFYTNGAKNPQVMQMAFV